MRRAPGFSILAVASLVLAAVPASAQEDRTVSGPLALFATADSAADRVYSTPSFRARVPITVFGCEGNWCQVRVRGRNIDGYAPAAKIGWYDRPMDGVFDPPTEETTAAQPDRDVEPAPILVPRNAPPGHSMWVLGEAPAYTDTSATSFSPQTYRAPAKVRVLGCSETWCAVGTRPLYLQASYLTDDADQGRESGEVLREADRRAAAERAARVAAERQAAREAELERIAQEVRRLDQARRDLAGQALLDAGTHPVADVRLAMTGVVRVGFSPELVRVAWGNPESINRTITAAGTREQWVYGRGDYVYIENGAVTAIQTSR